MQGTKATLGGAIATAAFAAGLLTAFVVELVAPNLYVDAQTRLDGGQLKAPRVAVMTCTKPATPPVTVTNPDGTTSTTPGSDCAGLYYLDVVTAAGKELRIVGPQIGDVVKINAADWTLVP